MDLVVKVGLRGAEYKKCLIFVQQIVNGRATRITEEMEFPGPMRLSEVEEVQVRQWEE